MEILYFNLVETVGKDAIDSLVDLLIYLQSDLDSHGYDNFIQEIFDVDYWTPITEQIIKIDLK